MKYIYSGKWFFMSKPGWTAVTAKGKNITWVRLIMTALILLLIIFFNPRWRPEDPLIKVFINIVWIGLILTAVMIMALDLFREYRDRKEVDLSTIAAMVILLVITIFPFGLEKLFVM